MLQPHVPAPISVAIACADGATLDILSRIVSDDADLYASGIASDTTSARSLLRDRGLNVLVICLSSFRGKRPSFGIDFVENAIQQRPDIGILVLAHETDKFVMREALEIGATACSLLSSPAKRLIGAIKAVSLGVTWLDREIAETILRAGKTKGELGTPLTRREHSVLHLIAEGYSNGEMAAVLRCATGTIDTHVMHVFRKLGVNDRVSAAVLALRQGILSQHSLHMKGHQH